jgi:hypothetical protein
MAQETTGSDNSSMEGDWKSHLLLYESRQVQEIEEGNCARRLHFHKRFLQAVYDRVPDHEHFLLMNSESI